MKERDNEISREMVGVMGDGGRDGRWEMGDGR